MSFSSLTARVIMLNSRLRGGGTDGQCLALAQGLAEQGWEVETAGPGSAPLSEVAPSLRPSPAFVLSRFSPSPASSAAPALGSSMPTMGTTTGPPCSPPAWFNPAP